MIQEVFSLDDERLDVFARLTDVQLRSRLEPQKGVFIAESTKVIERAVEAGMQPLSLLMEPKWLPSMEGLIQLMEKRNPGLCVFVMPRKALQNLTGFNLTRGALGAFRRPVPLTVPQVLRQARVIAILENITNHTNVGAIFRSAAGLGVDGILITAQCYDPLYRRALRVSMGAALQVPWARLDDYKGPYDWPTSTFALLHEHEFTTAALALKGTTIPLNSPLLKAAPKVALVLGTEGEGLLPTTIQACDHTVRIPMYHGVDSLNVAAASAVAFWELRR